MITTQPQQESTFLQDLQTGLDQFQSDDKLQSDLLLDGTHLFVGDALTAPGTVLSLMETGIPSGSNKTCAAIRADKAWPLRATGGRTARRSEFRLG